ncbi:MAG TPA: tRNA (N(6)-L-threonylcarbamoyladenosine(37)-C(2))-methylthiotransferase MtaB [Stellaceae bacterium]|nr:tRNA (N(6)-L-threonylcarbamoyladenosine(37)-C(2))-methylthiotransferase MtaB [Stellaceae bacterium]
MPLDIVTFGCRLNAFESEAIRREATEAGLDNAIIVNTCAVTAEAERQARQTIRKLRRENPGARLIVTGCAAQIDPARFAAMAEVDHVLGNAEKLRAESYRDLSARVSAGDIFAVRETASHLVEGFDGRARGFVQVQQGCDHRCTFCIIPFGRGASRSLPIAAVIEQARLLVERGYRELVLTGVDITAYGLDLPARPSLGRLCRDLLNAIPELTRLRLSSLDPAEIDAELWSLVADEPRLMPHLHLSLQAGDDLILKRMKRRHSRAQARDACARARRLRPGIALGADLIAGFPTESAAMFDHTLALVEETALDYLHVFPFSPRPGTPAARMPPVSRDLVRERAARLREAGTRALARSLAGRVGQVADVLIERDGFGRSEHYAPVRFALPFPLSAPGDGEGWGEGGETPSQPTSPSHAFGGGPSLSPPWAERGNPVVRLRLVASDGKVLDGIPA